MAITMKLSPMVDAKAALLRVSAHPLKSKDQPEGITPKTKMQIVKMLRQVADVTKDYGDMQASVYDALGIATGVQISDLAPGVWMECQRRMKEVGAVEVTIDAEPLRSSDIPLALAHDIFALGDLCELVE